MVASWSDPEWDDEQVDLVIAEQIVRANTGPNGEWMPDATSDKADPMSYSGMRYVRKGPFTNWAEKEKQDALDELRKKAGKDANLNGMFFTVERVDYPTD